MRFAFAFGALALLFLAAAPTDCGSAPPPAAAPPAAPPAVFETPPAQTIAVVWEGEDVELAEALRQGGFARWALPNLPGWRFEVGAAPEGVAVDLEIRLSRWPVAPQVRELAASLPVELDHDEVALGGTRYREPQAVVALRLPEAEHKTWLIVGGGEEQLVGMVDEILFQAARFGRRARSRPEIDYLVQESRFLSRRGRWRTVSGRFETDPATETDEIAERDRFYEGLVPIEPLSAQRPGGGPTRVTLMARPGSPESEPLRTLAQELDLAAREMAPRIGVPWKGEAIRIAVEPDASSLARHTGAIGEAVRGGKTDLALVFDRRDIAGYRFALAGELLERAGLSPGLSPTLAAGAALWLSRVWYGRDVAEWGPLLARVGELPTAEELIAAEPADDFSTVLANPITALIIERLPGRTLREKLANPPSVDALRGHLQALASATVAATTRAASGPKALDDPRRFLGGVSFAMRNSIDGGYHAPIVEREFERLAGLGVNAVSLMPFGFQDDPHDESIGFVHDSPSGETDFGLVVAARRAAARGFRILWKPHLWISRDSWPGEVEMKSEAAWKSWWRGYRRYVLHQAVLANWAGAELFSVGVELDRTTVREREWRDLIAAVRLLTPSAITYSANWDRAHTTPFWDAVDFVGVDCYFPLAGAEEGEPAVIARGAQNVVGELAAIAKAADRPVLLTEFGFPARRAAWSDPHREGGDFSEADQATAYRAFLRALGRPSWLAGVFVWKTHSNESTMTASEGADFRFLGRAAESEIRAYFGATDGGRAERTR